MNVPADPAPLHGMAPTQRFSDRADDYAKFRPTYPAEAIDALLAGLGDPTRLVSADVGAGTGISTGLLAARGCRVFALEPNRAMREAARPDPLVTWKDATAETTGLASGSVGLVLCAQSFHWFEPDAALAEFHRILAPRGRIGLLWNDRDVNDAATTAFSDAIRIACKDHPASHRHVRPEALFASKWFATARTLRFRQVQRLDADGLVGRAASASYVPKSGPELDTLVRTLRTLPARYAGPDGRVDLVYVTHLHVAERAP